MDISGLYCCIQPANPEWKEGPKVPCTPVFLRVDCQFVEFQYPVLAAVLIIRVCNVISISESGNTQDNKKAFQ